MRPREVVTLEIKSQSEFSGEIQIDMIQSATFDAVLCASDAAKMLLFAIMYFINNLKSSPFQQIVQSE